MLKSSKSMISTTHDQLLNVIYKIKNCYQQQHHQRYFDDLFSRCNNLKKQKRRPRNIRGNNKNKPKTKYLNSNSSSSYSNCIISSSSDNSNINITTTTTTTNSVPKLCYCANSNVEWSRVNLKNDHQISNFLRHIWLHFQKNFNNIQLVIVIFLLALITTTAHSIDTQGKPQQVKITTTSPSLLDSSKTPTFTSPTSSTIMPCYPFPNGLRTKEGPSSSLKFKPNICHNIRHIFHRHRNGQERNPLNYVGDKTSSKQLKLKSISNSNQNPIQIHHDQHNDHQQQHHNQDDSSVIIIDKQIQNFNSNTKVIKFKNNINNINMPKENAEDLSKNNNLNLNKFLQHIRTNNYDNKNNNNYNNNNINSKNNFSNDKLTFNVNTLKEDANDIINDQVVNDDHVEINNNSNSYTSLNLLPPVTTIITTGQTINDDREDDYSLLQNVVHNTDHHLQQPQQPQHIDHIKLMKLVMDGLGLKKAPNMKTANISQEEYVTKYREYLQRVHTRKRRELQDVLGEYDENILRPLEIFSIVSSSALQSKELTIPMRQKRNAREYRSNKEDADNDFDSDDYDDSDKKQSLEERVKNILLLKKKYQKPRSTKKERDERKTNIRLMFALKPEFLNLSSSDIEEANIRLVLIHSPILAIRKSKNRKIHTKPKNNSCGSSKNEGQKKLHQVNALNLKLYFISKLGKRVWLDGRTVDIHVDITKPDETHTQWLQFDVSKAVKTAIDDKRLQHVVLELQCDNCKRIGARILNDAYNTAADALADDPYTEGHQLMPVLNIIGHFDQSQRSMRPHKHDSPHSDNHDEATTQRHYHHQTYNNNKNRHNRRTNCYKANQRCCRHSMEVTFKEIKGFEFIIQPKVFDAGYCHGRCPPRYNPAHHHAMLQSLIWKQNHHKAPRPCCAPSKLVELEVLHVDEKDSEKLKISTWSDMKVVECACS